jgi:hypothetical protein
MRRLSLIGLGTAAAGLVLGTGAGAQTGGRAGAAPVQQTANTPAGRPITPDVIRNWNTIRQGVLSGDGKWFAYVTGSTESDGTLILRRTA